jgi:hypothetical protein
MCKSSFSIALFVIAAIVVPVAAFGQGAPVVSADISRTADGLNAVADTLNREEVAAEDAWYDRHELSLGVDGNLPGNLRVFDESGRMVPARVKLYFLQSGKVISQATPNDDGDFQVVGLKSGTYSLVAAGQSGFAAMGIRVLPPPDRPDPPKANTIGRIRTVSQPGLAGLHLNISVIPAVDVQPAFGLAASANAGGLGSLPGLSGLGGAPGGAATGSASSSAASGGGGGGAAGAGGLGGVGTLGALGAAGAAMSASQNDNNSGQGASNTTSTTTPASDNGGM